MPNNVLYKIYEALLKIADNVSTLSQKNDSYFSAYLSSDQAVSSDDQDRIEFDETDYDYNGDFDTTNNEFVAPVSAIYVFTATITFYTNDANARYALLLESTSKRLSGAYEFAVFDGFVMLNVSYVGYIPAGDKVYLDFYQNSGNSVDIRKNSGDTVTIFNGSGL